MRKVPEPKLLMITIEIVVRRQRKWFRAHRKWQRALAATCLVAGCDSAPREAADDGRNGIAVEPATGLRHGIVTPRASGFTFVPCGSSDTLALDASEPLVTVMKTVADSGASAFAIAHLASPTGADTIFFATREQFECHSDWSSFRYRATGSNPGWVAEVKNSALHVRRQNAPDTIVQVSQIAGPDVAFAAADSAVTLRLEWRECRQNNGAYHAWSARLAIGGRTYRGCGVPGQRDSGK